MSLFFDARSSLVYVCAGPLIVGWMTLGDFRGVFGVEAVRELIHGDAMREVK